MCLTLAICDKWSIDLVKVTDTYSKKNNQLGHICHHKFSIACTKKSQTVNEQYIKM